MKQICERLGDQEMAEIEYQSTVQKTEQNYISRADIVNNAINIYIKNLTKVKKVPPLVLQSTYTGRPFTQGW